MATPIVIQLQQDALDKEVAVSDLLRKAKLVAVKLDLRDAAEWIEHELNGYSAASEVPDYREVRGQPRGFNPYQGWIPIMFTGDNDTQNLISNKKLGQSVASLEHLLETEGPLSIPFDAGAVGILSEALGIEPTQMAVFFGQDRVVGILSAVRNKVLDWSLSLEKAGILGDGLSFSQKEKAAAKEKGDTFNIQNFSGVIGDVRDHAKVRAAQTVVYGAEDLRKIVDQVKRYADGLELPPKRRKELDGAIVVIEGELAKAEPDRGKLRRAFAAVKRIGEAVTGNVVAEGVVALINQIPWDSITF